jgi:hypothetical protein
MEKKTGYVIRLYGTKNQFAWGKYFICARVFPTLKAARKDKQMGVKFGGYTKPQKIYRVELSSKNRPKRIIKKVR